MGCQNGVKDLDPSGPSLGSRTGKVLRAAGRQPACSGVREEATLSLIILTLSLGAADHIQIPSLTGRKILASHGFGARAAGRAGCSYLSGARISGSSGVLVNA